MLPPVDPTVLQQNPNFELLYKDICTRKLNLDGSSRDTKKQKIHAELRQNLSTSLTALHSNAILLRTLSDLPSKTSELPSELHSMVELAAAQLGGHIQANDREVLIADMSTFHDCISVICEAISNQLTTIVSHLCVISDPLNPPQIMSLNARAAGLKDAATESLPVQISTASVELANTAYQVLSFHRQILQSSIQLLEQTMHGSLARSTRAKAELLHSRATILGLQAKIHTFSHPPPPDFVRALKNFRVSQGISEAALRDRESLARQALKLYEKAGEKGMKDISKRAKHLTDEIRRLENEVARLEGGEV
ncbi:hypothetical protein BS50DRAFT_593045 [Corynespora cassiicola Philippines]|uniref:Uncharacterized protein n=1 Tax=Corynespora cassiicola Philippines TaxID=1448308 RepID=A0A2T2N6Q2_CORCC|nr:hypothetical protein BS50DRAFT_593045 [Corynespora cassiicola Philippines]